MLIDNYYLEFYRAIKGEEWANDPMNWSDFEFREFNKSPFQWYAIRMVYFHFGKRVLEEFFISWYEERPTGQTTLWKFFQYLFFYWFVFGFGVGYFVMHPFYEPLLGVDPSNRVLYPILGLYIVL